MERYGVRVVVLNTNIRYVNRRHALTSSQVFGNFSCDTITRVSLGEVNRTRAYTLARKSSHTQKVAGETQDRCLRDASKRLNGTLPDLCISSGQRPQRPPY